MSAIDWQKLRRDLLLGGVAPKHVRRTIDELGAHYEDLKTQAISEGLQEEEGAARAQRELGDAATILDEVLSKPELRSWAATYPRAFFLLVPVLSVLASFAIVIASVLFLASSAGWLEGLEDGSELTLWRKAAVESWFFLNCYVVTPALALGVVAIARQRMVAPQWPAIGIVLLTVLGSGWAYNIGWPEDGGAGNFTLNWGFSFLPRVVRGFHDWQNFLQIGFTLLAVAAFWRYHDPLRTKFSSAH